ncbi:hypothetical protein OROMI_015108 [Orobanche minor]
MVFRSDAFAFAAQHFPRIRTPPRGSVMSTRNLGVLDRAQPKKAKKKTLMTVRAKNAREAAIVRTPRGEPQAEVTVAVAPPEAQPVVRSVVDLTRPKEGEGPEQERPEQEKQLVLRKEKRPREEVPSAGSPPPRLTLEPPIAATPLSMKKPRTGEDILREFAAADAETSRGKPFFGRDTEKAKRVLHLNPGCPSTVVDFLSSRTPQDRTQMPSYLARALDAMPKSWTTNLDQIAERHCPDAANACLMLTLQAAVMAAQVAREAEGRPSVPRLEAELAEERQKIYDLTDRLTSTEKELQAAPKKASQEAERGKRASERLQAELVDARKEADLTRKEAAAQIVSLKGQLEAAEKEAALAADRAAQAAERAAQADDKAAQAAEGVDLAEQKAEAAARELAAKTVELGQVGARLAALEAEEKERKDDPCQNARLLGEFAYYVAYGDALRVAAKGGLDVGPLLEAFKAYVSDRPLDPYFTVPILDLSTELGIDLTWYPQPDRLCHPDSPDDGDDEGEEGDGGEEPEPEGTSRGAGVEEEERLPSTDEPASP